MNIEVDNLNVNYKITGDGEKVAVILQGWGTTLQVYDSVAALLSEQYKVIQFDFPGFGKSDEPKEAWDVDAYTDFFCKLMQKLEIDSATLIGHSYGGRVIIKLASRESIPFEIEKIVLVDSAGVLPKKTFSQKMRIRRYKIFKKIFSIKLIYALFPEIVDDWRSRQGSEDYRNSSPIMRACLVKAVNEDLTKLLSEIKQETLIIWGKNDDSTPVSDAYLMDKLIADSGLAVIEGAGHFSFLDQPVTFKKILSSFLNV